MSFKNHLIFSRSIAEQANRFRWSGKLPSSNCEACANHWEPIVIVLSILSNFVPNRTYKTRIIVTYWYIEQINAKRIGSRINELEQQIWSYITFGYIWPPGTALKISRVGTISASIFARVGEMTIKWVAKWAEWWSPAPYHAVAFMEKPLWQDCRLKKLLLFLISTSTRSWCFLKLHASGLSCVLYDCLRLLAVPC